MQVDWSIMFQNAEWQQMTSDPFILDMVKGAKISHLRYGGSKEPQCAKKQTNKQIKNNDNNKNRWKNSETSRSSWKIWT